MTKTQLSLSPRTLVSLLSHLTGTFPNPDDSPPVGPWGPILRLAHQNLLKRSWPPRPIPWALRALNPQPIPPVETFAAAFASAFIAQVASLQSLAEALPSDSRKNVQDYTSAMITRLVGDCGNETISIPGLGRGPWPPGDDEPRPISPVELVGLGVSLIGARSVHPDFEAAGGELLELGLKRFVQG